MVGFNFSYNPFKCAVLRVLQVVISNNDLQDDTQLRVRESLDACVLGKVTGSRFKVTNCNKKLLLQKCKIISYRGILFLQAVDVKV